MDNKQKEFYVNRVEKYSDEIKRTNKVIVVFITLVGVQLLLVLTSLSLNTTAQDTIWELTSLCSYLSKIAPLTITTITLFYYIAKKAGYKGTIDEIRLLLKHHGFNLDDEKEKGMRR